MVNAAKQQTLRGRLLHQEAMSRYTSWRVGGAAKNFYEPEDRDGLISFISTLDDQEIILFVGLGSNLLVRDGGINGTVIHLQGGLNELSIIDKNQDSSVVYAEAGVTSAQLARFAAKQSLAGGEFFAGIPGTVGGALAMNAGAFGSETWQFVQSVETINRAGQVKLKTPEDYTVGYRSVVSNNKDIEQEWFIAASFRFNGDPGAVEQKRIRELLNQRSATQPIGTRSCGSVFRNPPGDYAARLIESCGLKGKRIGGAHISEKHANFIINDEAAKADDIEQLINLIQMTVEEKTNIKLKTEVTIVGDPL